MRTWSWSLVSLSLVGVLACSHSRKAEAPNFTQGMQNLAGQVRDILPYLYSRQAYLDPNNKLIIQDKLKQFKGHAHRISPQAAKPYFGNDPLVSYSLENLGADLQRSLEAFQMGQLEYSQSVAKSVVNHCFRCHSVANPGATSHWDLSSLETSSMSSLDRMDLLVAGRQYDEALKLMTNQLLDKNFLKKAPFDYEQLLRKYLALMVRVKQDPKAALKMIEQILATEELPYYIGEQVRSWKRSLAKWSGEKRSRSSKIKLARTHMQTGRGLQRYAKDHAGDVEFLRATTEVHDFLKSAKVAPKDLTQAYYILGEAYEVLDELGYWNLHEVYYESCILKAPHDPLARSCFGRLEASVYSGYSGSSGTHIPAQEMDRLNRLKSLMR